MTALDREANLLGALSLLIADQTAQAVASATEQSAANANCVS